MSRQTFIQWPEDELGCPLRAEYLGTVDERFIRTTVADGPARFRLVRQEERRVYSLAFIWTDEQAAIWESFHEFDLGRGLRWFEMAQLTGVISGTNMRPWYCHIVAGWRVRPLSARLDRVQIEFEVEAFRTPGTGPLPGIVISPINGRNATDPRPADIINALAATDPRPADIVNALGPGMIPT